MKESQILQHFDTDAFDIAELEDGTLAIYSKSGKTDRSIGIIVERNMNIHITSMDESDLYASTDVSCPDHMMIRVPPCLPHDCPMN